MFTKLWESHVEDGLYQVVVEDKSRDPGGRANSRRMLPNKKSHFILSLKVKRNTCHG